MTIEKKLIGTNPVASGGDSPEAVSFDGSGDHLKRTSDLTNNANGKTFTFSAWVYRAKDAQANILDNNTAGVLVQMDSQGSVGFRFMNAGTSAGINHTSGKAIPLNTWTHICMSADLNVSGSAKIFFNDVPDTQSISQSNTNISFSTGIHYIGGEDGTGSFMNGRLAHVFLDYRYRDLTIEANRRFFITSDGKPAEDQDSVDTASTDYLDVSGRGSGYLSGMCFNNNGTRLLISEGGTDDIFQYNLSTGFDLSTASYAGYNINGSSHGNYIQDVQFKDNGTKVYFGGNGGSNSIHQYNLTTANDISTASEFGSKAVSSVVGANRLFITDDGSKMYVADNYTIARWNLSTNFNITTASHVNTKILPYKIASIQFNADGTEMYLAEAVRDAMVTYTLSTAYDPTTAVLKHYKFLNYMDTTLVEAIFNNDGSKLYVLGDNTNKIYEMLVSTPFDARTAVYGALQGSPAAPIMYLPMKDAATAGSNSGTGGDFTAIGVLDTAGRGPNQDNCSASVFDGSADYLTSSFDEWPGNSKVFTVSGTINVTTGSDGLVYRLYRNGAGVVFQITTDIYGSLYIKGYNTSYQNRFYVQWKNSIGANNALRPNHNYHFSLSVDMSNTSKRHLIINGAAVSPTYTYYTVDAEMGFDNANRAAIGYISGTGYFKGSIGELYLDPSYTDLSADNPFWDEDSNRPNSVRKVISTTGLRPVMALPLQGDNAGANFGWSGDFTVNSGPYTGARGGSEFYARSLRFDNTSNGQVSKTSALTGNSTATTITIAFAIKATNLSGDDGIWGFDGYRQYMYRSESGSGIAWQINNTSGNAVLRTNSFSISNYGTSGFDVYLMSCDLSAFQAKVYKNGVASGAFTIVSSPTGGVNAGIADKAFSLGTGEINGGGDKFNGDISAFYYDNSYLDFSQEANRNKFVDQLGFFKDLTPAIEAGDIPNPLIYLKFDPTVSFGTNSGRGGNFNSVGSSVISGDDMKPS